jgi:hypothetical protein
MGGAIPSIQATYSAYSFSFLTRPVGNKHHTAELTYQAPCVCHTYFRQFSFSINPHMANKQALSYVYVSGNNFNCGTAESEARNKHHSSFVTD